MKLTLAFLVVALCSSLGNGNPVGREKRQTGNMKVTYYETQGKGGSSGGGSYGGGSYGGGSQVQSPQYSQGQAEMFAFMFQGATCIFESVKDGPADKKAAAYEFIVTNTIRFVETTAASCGMKSADQLFIKQEDLNFYLQLKLLASTGDYSNFAKVESTYSGLLGGLAGSLGGLLVNLGATAGNAVKLVTGLLGGLPIAGPIVAGLGGVAGDLLGTAGNILGGVVGTVGNVLDKLTGGILGGKDGGLLGGLLGGGDKKGGGLLGGLLGGGGDKKSDKKGGLLGGILG